MGEARAALRALGVELPKAEVRRIVVAELGRDPDGGGSGEGGAPPSAASVGCVSWDDFLSVAAPRLPDRWSDGELAKVFALFDAEGVGSIGLRDLRRVVGELGEGGSIGEAELGDMIGEADSDGDGRVSLVDFLRLMRRRGDPWGSGFHWGTGSW